MTAESTRLVVKVGSSSVTDQEGTPNAALLAALASEIDHLSRQGTEVVVVSSGAVAAGWATIGAGKPRPQSTALLQAVSAVGQHRLMSTWAASFAEVGRTVGQVLLAPLDFADRQHYLHARQTLEQLLNLGVIPIVNENDAVADDEIRFGDNDRLAALVAHLVGATRLVMLTDAPGLLTADPRTDAEASLIEEVSEIDRSLEEVAGGPGAIGSGGMASKLAAARIATWSGVEAVIAPAAQEGVLELIERGALAVGTTFRARDASLSARKLWIAFALRPTGRVHIDQGAAAAIAHNGRSLLAPGISQIEGSFEPGDAVEILDDAGQLVAKGLIRRSAQEVAAELTAGSAPRDPVLVHRDDLVVLVGA